MKTKLAFALAATMLAHAVPVAVAPALAQGVQVVSTLNGVASWYGPRFHGNLTANGERFDMNQLTAAHKTLPFGTRVRVTNENNGESVIVRINDRGPYVGGRSIDLSRAAATQIDMINSGTASVTLEVLATA